jgi:hypothetical protein
MRLADMRYMLWLGYCNSHRFDVFGGFCGTCGAFWTSQVVLFQGGSSASSLTMPKAVSLQIVVGNMIHSKMSTLSPRPTSPKAFNSHSTKDRAFVERLATDLRANGVDAWYVHAEVDRAAEGIAVVSECRTVFWGL